MADAVISGGARRRSAASTAKSTASHRVAGCLVALAIAPGATQAQGDCYGAPTLPAYSHNDYQNARPLHEALELGFRGVEADVIYRGRELRIGHDPADTRRGRNLEKLYLQPLRAIVQRCGSVLGSAGPLLFNIELKERSRPTYDSLLATIGRYPDLFEAGPPGGTPPVQLVLVGWYPAPGDSMFEAAQGVGRQEKITSLSPEGRTRPSFAVRLVSLDYGKTIGWSGEGPPPEKASKWLAQLRAAGRERPGRLTRVYNAPVHPAVYRLLLEGGVDLIGTERLVASQGVLRHIVIPQARTGGQ